MPRLDLGISWRQIRSVFYSALRLRSWNGNLTLGDAKIKSWHDVWGHDGMGRWHNKGHLGISGWRLPIPCQFKPSSDQGIIGILEAIWRSMIFSKGIST